MSRLASHLLDDTVGFFANALHLALAPSENTLAELEEYRDRPPAEMFPAPRTVPEVAIRRRWKAAGLVAEDLTFASDYAPLSETFRRRYEERYRANRTAYARRVRTPGRARGTILYLHGWLQPETPFEELTILATMALRLGMDVVQLQPPYHGRRTPKGSLVSGEFYWTADMVRSIESLRQNLWDARALLGWLLTETGGPVGAAGLSLGGSLTLALAGLEDRFAFAVPMIAHLDLGALLADAPVLGRMRRDLRRFGWGPEDLHDFMGSIGWNDLKPRLPPERMLFVAARHDKFFPADKVEALRQRWGAPAVHWYEGGHMEIAFNLWGAVTAMQRFLRDLDLG